MADRELIGNCALVALCAGSCAVWGIVVARKARGLPPLELVEQPAVSWRVAPVCATFLVAYLMPTFVMTAVSAHIGSREHVSLVHVQWQCAYLVAQVITVVGLLAIAGPLKKSDFGWELTNWRSDVLVGAIGWLASFFPIVAATRSMQFANWRGPDDRHVLFDILENSSDRWAPFWVVLSAAVLAPIAEELLFRVLLQGWAQGQMAPWQAIAFSSFVFVAQHAVYDWLPLMPLALILGYVYNRRRSYVAVVVLHALFNGVMLGLAMLAKK